MGQGGITAAVGNFKTNPVANPGRKFKSIELGGNFETSGNPSKSFGEIFAVLLHELCHVFGGDGRRSFSDILTYLLRMAIEERQSMDILSQNWQKFQFKQLN